MKQYADKNDWIVVNLSHDLPPEEVAMLTTRITSTTRKCYVTTPSSRLELSAQMPKSIGLRWTHPENTNYIDLTIVDEHDKPAELPSVAELSMWGEIRSRLPHMRFEYEGMNLHTDAVRIHFDRDWREFMLGDGLRMLTEIMGSALQPFYLNRILPSSITEH